MVHVMLLPKLNVLYLNISTFRSMCAVPIIAVFCSSLILRFPGMLLLYYYGYTTITTGATWCVVVLDIQNV